MSAPAPNASEGIGPAIDDPTFARLIARLGPFERRPRLAVAVSGGPDSLALTLLAARWAGARGGSVVGLTIDHGLRPEAAAEAATVGAWLHGRAIDHAALAWTGPKPLTGIQAAARRARYRLLGDYCRAHRILHLLLAHHRDDQVETVALRRERGSGAGGLAGMPAIVERRGFRLLRPLLTVPKGMLRGYLERAGQAWLDDPSNRSPAFARTRLRTMPGGAGDAGQAAAAGAARAAVDRAASLWLARHARVDPLGFVEVAAPALRDAPPDLAREILRRVLLTVGGNPYPPRSAALARLVAALLEAGSEPTRTLGGVVLEDRGERLRAVRESGAIRPLRQPLERRVWFDHRFEISSRAPRPDLGVGPLGEAGWLIRRRLAPSGPAPAVARRVGQSLPAIFRGDELVLIPALALALPGAVAPDLVRVRCRPRHPLAGAPYAAAGAVADFASGSR